MPRERDQRRLLTSRGILLVEDFCRATGLPLDDIVDLMHSRLGHCSLWRDAKYAQPFGIWDDALPSREALLGWGYAVADSYDPAALVSYEA